MKIVVGEEYVDLVPETEFERKQLRQLDRKNIQSCRIPEEFFESRNWPAHVSSNFVLRLSFPAPDWGL